MTDSDTNSQNRNAVLSRGLMFSLYIPALVLSLGIGIVTPVLPVYAKSFGITFGEASLHFVIYQLGALAFTFPTGFLMDTIGRRPVLLADPIITALASLLTAAAHSYPEILVYRFVSGAANELWMQSRLAIIADSAATHQRARQITWMVGMQRAGTMPGPALGGLLAGAFDIRIPFIVHDLLMLAIVISSFSSTKETVNATISPHDGVPTGASDPDMSMRDLIRFILTTQMLAFFLVHFWPPSAGAEKAGPSTSMPFMPTGSIRRHWALSAFSRGSRRCRFLS